MTIPWYQFETNHEIRPPKSRQSSRPFRLAPALALCALIPALSANLTVASAWQASAAGSPRAATQTTKDDSPTAQPSPKWRLLSKAEGRSIINAASQHDQRIAASQDCSHLVHEIYSAAGYEFPYATSFALYAGNPSFGRVKHAQPGDVIAWPGHVGIVVSPSRHSFFSLVRSGAEEEDYTSPYWRSRGRARFYRFLVLNSSHSTAPKKISISAAAQNKRENPENLSPKDAVVRQSDAPPSQTKVPIMDTSERAPVAATSDPPGEVSSATPLGIPIGAAERNPTRQDVADAIAQSTQDSGEVLRTGEPLRSRVPVVIFEQLAVDRVHIKGDRGVIELRVDYGVSLNGDGVDFKHRHEKLRWELRRTDSGWLAIPPAERAYVSRDLAVRIFAAQLSQLAASDLAAAHDETVLGQEARLANLLTALLQAR